MIRTLLFFLFLIPVAAPAQEALKEREYIHTLTSADANIENNRVADSSTGK